MALHTGSKICTKLEIHNFNPIELIFKQYYLSAHEVMTKFHNYRAKIVEIFTNSIFLSQCHFLILLYLLIFIIFCASHFMAIRISGGWLYF